MTAKPNNCEGGNGRVLRLQWHITERCNFRCSHCYQDSQNSEELDFRQLIQVMDQYKDLLKNWKGGPEKPARGHINVTGGEPFIRHDFLDLLELFAGNRRHFSHAILSNGSFIDRKMAKRLRQLRTSFVQVSIEGTEETHNRVRGAGNYGQAVSALKNLVKEGVRAIISFTAHRDNYREFTDVARLGRRLKVSRVWADRLIPYGNALNMVDKLLSPEETQEFFGIMEKARPVGVWSRFQRTKVSMERALQFQVGGGRPYRCTAGDSLITVQPNGDLYPCRRMPVPVGNLMEHPLEELYYDSELFRALRGHCVSEGCETCFYSELCRGGLKCLSLAVTGDPFKADPGCLGPAPGSGKMEEDLLVTNL